MSVHAALQGRDIIEQELRAAIQRLIILAREHGIDEAKIQEALHEAE